MHRSTHHLIACLGITCCLHLCAPPANSQTNQTQKTPSPPSPSEQGEDVLKINTELIQTDVMVFDKQGRFVNGLKREDFELRVDGKPQPVSFFDQVQAGTASEDAKLAAARGRPSPTKAEDSGLTPLDRGRPVFFFVDDLHLSTSSMDQTRKLLLRYIERDLKQNDQAAIVTATGALGFLEQLTDDRTVLRTAAEHLAARSTGRKDTENPPMSDYEALQITRGDKDTLRYFVDVLIKQSAGGMVAASIEAQVRARASLIVQQVNAAAIRTLSSLRNVAQSSANVPGRKVLFLLSDGFVIDEKHSDTTEWMHSVTASAGRSGTVIYAIDPRGLTAHLSGVENNTPIDPSGGLVRGRQGEVAAAQDVLSALGADSGGRALLNNNELYEAVDRGLKETASYYLLAWRPLRETDHANKFRRLEVAVAGKPDLTVRVRRGFADLEPQANTVKATGPRDPKDVAQIVDARLKEAISAPYPPRQIPISLGLLYLDTAQRGSALTVMTQIDSEFLTVSGEASKREAAVDLTGGVFDSTGKLGARFSQQLTLPAATDPNQNQRQPLTYAYGISLGPGLYQVRVVARDAHSGNLGGSNQWIEIPKLLDRQLTLSSLIVGERPSSDSATSAGASPVPGSVPASFDRRFKRGSFLRYQVFIYNSVPPPPNTAPDVTLQIQVLRDDQPVRTTLARKVPTEGIADLQRLPYAAELALEDLPAGRYLLKVIVIDRLAKTSKTQQTPFEIY